ncbi:hypothetical protein [Sphingosinicella sp. BN140058]|uniref:hypothetical protein n=1 Tax=Sphingosinicella sp. BN140058 TaxID=1892855 RepID=UPI0010121686|nr:hypothetical protein [Sphingosinicella sp. BN140058]QAY78932.1 hypothetical protein ETR14_22115 [Sphingosinicella sp. BN140058]
MIDFILSSVAAVASAGTGQQIEHTSETLFCRQEVRERPNGAWFLAALEVDKLHRPVRRSITLLGDQYRASWVYSEEQFRSDQPMAALEIGSIALPRNVRFPVTATIRFGGTIVWTKQISRATHTVIKRDAPLAGSARIGQPGIEIDTGTAQIPSLFGETDAQVIVVEADGAVGARQVLAVPDWVSSERRLSEAFVALEGDRAAGRCRATVTVTIVD